MISVLLIVFLLQLAIHLLNTQAKQTVNDVLWALYTRLPISQSKDGEDTSKLRKEVVRLNREMTATSTQDNFAKWARLRRDHDKAKEKYDKQSNDQQSFRASFDSIVSKLRWLGTTGLQFFCNFWFGKQAMFWLPQGWVPYPVEWIVSFPKAPLGSISVNIWTMACASVIALVSEAVIASWTLREGKVVEGSNKGEKVRMESMPAGGEGGKKEL